MSDYIKREDLMERVGRWQLNTREAIAEMIMSVPSADVVEIKKEGEWDMFDLISSAWYGKGMYFKQDNGTVYSRHSGEYITVDEAISEFISLIDEENGEAPTYVQLKKGKWLKKHDKISYWHECSECGEKAKTNSHFNIILSNYCPNCGADMRGERNDENI